LPAALARFYQLAGKAERIGSQNHILAPSNLVWIDGRIVFYEENQGNCRWATGADTGDGPVWFQMTQPAPWQSTGPWEAERAPLSIFLLQLVLYEYAMGGGGSCQAWLDSPVEPKALKDLLGSVELLPYQPFGWPSPGAWFYASHDAVVVVTGDTPTGEAWANIAAEDRSARDGLVSLARADWEVNPGVRSR
jgi:hypothetical protein